MTLQKAIEIGQLNVNFLGKCMPPDVRAALILLIEAGKCIENNRRFGIPNSVNPLPGETKD